MRRFNQFLEHNNRVVTIISTVLFFTLSSSFKLYAEEAIELETFTVNIDKRERSLQDVPASISVISSEDLDLIGGKSLADAANLAPNVIVQNQGGRTSTYFYTRGIGRSELNFPIVSVNVNGVALPDPSFFGIDLDAAEQVEFLRGPQGTIFGQNTLGGVINIKLKQPTEVFEGEVEVNVGERDFRESTLRLSGPIFGDKLKAAATLLWRDLDGYIENTTRNETQNPEKTLGGSLYLIAEPTDNLGIEFNYFGQKRDDGLPWYAQGNDLFEVTNDAPTDENTEANIVGLKVAYDWDNITFISQTGWSDINRFTQADVDFSPFPAFSSSSDNDIEQWSQEFRLQYASDSLDYVIGFYTSGMDNHFNVFINDLLDSAGLGTPIQINDLVDFSDATRALFGQVNWRTGLWELVFGLRYHHQKIETDNANIVRALNSGFQLIPTGSLKDSTSFSVWLPKLAATYQWNDYIKLYGSISRGVRAGGFNNTALTARRAGISLPTNYDAEYTTNYEIGTKWLLPNYLGRVDLALFYIDWSELQAEQIANGTLFDFRTNAASASSFGAEIEMRLYPRENWEVGFTAGYAKAEYNDFVVLQTGENLKGNQVAGGAEFTWSTFVRYRNDTAFGRFGIFGNLSASGIKERYFDVNNQVKGDNYTLVNGRIGLSYQNLETYVFANNLLDERYIDYSFPAFGTAVGEPRMVGVGLSYSW